MAGTGKDRARARQGITARALRAAIVTVAAFAVASCASDRPAGLTCNLGNYVQANTGLFPFATGAEDFSELNVLALSAGGEYGAFGTGYMRGWSEASAPKPIAANRIGVVTGVSTGAIIATHIFLGRYAEIDEIYRKVKGADIYKQRAVIGALFGDSLTDASGKDALIATNLSKEVIDAVAAEAEAHPSRRLLVGTVDIDTGQFLRIDLSRLASDTRNPNRDACYRAAVGAASAIPIAFPPIFVDGRMLVDGGLRHYTFLQNIDDVFKGKLVKRRLFAIYHGDLSAGRDKVANGVLSIAGRISSVALDELIKDAAYRLDYVARLGPEDQRFETYYLDAKDAARTCAPKRTAAECKSGEAGDGEDMFCHPFMECLSDEGRKAGRRNAENDTWARELMTRSLGSDP